MGVLLLLLRLLCVVLAAADAVFMLVGSPHVVRSLTAAVVWSSTDLDACPLSNALRSASLCCALAVDSALAAAVVGAVLVVATTVLVSVAGAGAVVVVVFIAVSAGVAFGGVGCGLLRQLLSLYIYKPKSHKIVRAIKCVCI